MIYTKPTEEQLDIIKVLDKRGYYVTKDIARLLRISERTVIRWRNERLKGKKVGVPFVKIEKTYAYFPEHLEAYIRENTY